MLVMFVFVHVLHGVAVPAASGKPLRVQRRPTGSSTAGSGAVALLGLLGLPHEFHLEDHPLERREVSLRRSEGNPRLTRYR